MRSNNNHSQFDRPAEGDDNVGRFDPSELKDLLGDEAQLAETRDSFDAIETLFERVRIPDEVSASFVGDVLSPGLSTGRESHLELPGFREKAVLGIGGFGTVFLAHDEKLERDVAVKVPRADRWLSDDRERFLEEARLAAKLKHPGIVTLLELVEHSERYHLVSELVDGETLQDWMDRGDIYWRDASQLAQSIAEAMAHAHDHQVIHRDLKPTNVLLDLDGQPKVADFGLAVRREAKSTEQVLAAGTLELHVARATAYKRNIHRSSNGHLESWRCLV